MSNASCKDVRPAVKVLAYTVAVVASLIIGVGAFVVWTAVFNPPFKQKGGDFYAATGAFEADTTIGFVPRPQFVSAYGTGFFTDSRGARADGPGIQAPSAVDVISVGCSITFGYGVRNEETFTRVLSILTGLSAENFGVIGYGGISSLLWMQRQLDLRPKIIVYGLWEDHYNRNVVRCFESGMAFCVERPIVIFDRSDSPVVSLPEGAVRGFEWGQQWRERQRAAEGSRAVQFVEDVLVSWSVILTKLERVARRAVDSPEDKRRAMEFVLLEMNRSARSVGARLIVVFIPLYFKDVVDEAPRELVEFARESGIFLVSMTDGFIKMKRDGTPIAIPGDGHPSPAVHHVMAEEIAAALRMSGYLNLN